MKERSVEHVESLKAEYIAKHLGFNLGDLSYEGESIRVKDPKHLPPTPGCSQRASPSPIQHLDEIQRHQKEQIKNESVRMCTRCVYSFSPLHATDADRIVNPNYKMFSFAVFGTTTQYDKVRMDFLDELQGQKVSHLSGLPSLDLDCFRYIMILC